MHTAALQDRQGTKRFALVSAGIITFALLGVALRPAPAVAAKTFEQCIDQEWADYNSCLVNAGSSWGRRLCDHYFSAGIFLCSAKYVGEVKKAYENGF